MTELRLSTILLAIFMMRPERKHGVLANDDPDPKPLLRETNNQESTRTYPPRPYRLEGCDNLALYCFKSYTTGALCGRTIENNNYFNKYQDFKNYCEMDFMNCNEGFDVWQVAHMGQCMLNAKYHNVKHFEYYEYVDDLFMDNVYVIPN